MTPLPKREGGGKMAKKRADMTKEEKITSEKNRLKKHYTKLHPSKKALAQGLIEQAAFMRIELAELAKDLEENGWTEMFSQGKEEPYERARPTGQIYNTTNSNYQKIIDKLDKLLPKEEPEANKKEDDGFEQFVSGRDDA